MRRNLGLALAFSFALTVTACANGDSGGGGSSGSEIPLGFVYQGGGGFNNLSLSFVHGIQVAADEVNKAGGITVGGKKYTFTVDTCNDHFDQTQTTGCANRLVLDNKDRFMFGGPADFGPILRGVTERNKVIYVSRGAGPPGFRTGQRSTPAASRPSPASTRVTFPGPQPTSSTGPPPASTTQAANVASSARSSARPSKWSVVLIVGS
jgi:ABC-type branched-subunit amino acid transport system substrate-binding protein